MTDSKNTKYHVHISSRHNLLDLKLREVWQYRDLIRLFVQRSFAVSYKQTILGPLWLFINPLMTSVIYVFLFGYIARLGTDGIPQMLFYLSGNAMWSYFSSSLSNNASTFTGNSHIFGKVYFPRLTVPIANVINASIRFLIQFLLVFVLLIFYMVRGQVHPHLLAWLLLPFVMLWLGILGLGCGIIISSVTTKYRDLSVLVGFGLQIWMYATPVVYPLSTISSIGSIGVGADSLIYRLLLLNPVTMPIEIYRYAVLGVGTISLPYVITSLLMTIVIALIGVIIFNRIERTFMDTV